VRTDKFDIGQYKLALVASSPGFFGTGSINASLNIDGKTPLQSEQ